MTIAELIQELQSLNVAPDTPINFRVNDFNKAEVETIKVQEYTRILQSDGSWKTHKEIDLRLHSDDLEG